MRNIRRRPPPETLAQASFWERTRVRYLDVGLCDRCAAQAAWGHQKGAGGWSMIKSPCLRCAEVVSSLPMETPNPVWRKTLRHPASTVGATAWSGTSAGTNKPPVVEVGAGAL